MYYLQSRYYSPEMGRFISADTTYPLLCSPNELTDKNLFAYCDNNPVMRKDSEGDFWGFAIVGWGALGGTLSFGGANFWNPVGWAALGIATLATIIYVCYIGYEYYECKHEVSCSKKDDSSAINSPIGRANRKQQGREVNEKKRKHKDFKSRSNKDPNRGMKRHTPSKRGHRK